MHSVWNMEEHWEQMDQEIAQSPMPPEYQGVTVKVRSFGTHQNIFNLTQSINPWLTFCIYNFVFFATDNVQWLPNTLHSAFPRTGDEVQQLWLLQYCTGRRPHAAADRAGCWEWSRNRAAYPAPVSVATLERRPTLFLQQIMMGNTWPKNWSQNTLDGKIKRGPVQNKFSSSRPSVSFKNK